MEKSAALPWIKTFILILLVLLISSSPGRADGFKDAAVRSPDGEVIIRMKARKLIGVEAWLDYQDPSPNPAHDPRKGGPGGRGNIP